LSKLLETLKLTVDEVKVAITSGKWVFGIYVVLLSLMSFLLGLEAGFPITIKLILISFIVPFCMIFIPTFFIMFIINGIEITLYKDFNKIKDKIELIIDDQFDSLDLSDPFVHNNISNLIIRRNIPEIKTLELWKFSIKKLKNHTIYVLPTAALSFTGLIKVAFLFLSINLLDGKSSLISDNGLNYHLLGIMKYYFIFFVYLDKLKQMDNNLNKIELLAKIKNKYA